MKLSRVALTLISLLSIPSRAEDAPRWIYATGAGVVTQEIMTEPVRVRPAFRAGFDWKFESLLWGSVLGLEVSGYNQAFGPVTMDRATFFLRLGRRLFDDKLMIAGLLGSVHSHIDGYESGSAGAYGLNASYKVPLGKKFDVNFTAGWFYARQHSVKRETGRTETSAVTQAFCSLFTFGLTNCPYDYQYEYVSIPQSHQGLAGVGLGYSF